MQKRHNHDRPIERAVRRLVRQYKAASDRIERREHGRTHFIRQVKAVADNGRDYTVLTRDISLSGVRLLSNHSLLGQHLRVRIPIEDDSPETYCFVVRILWSAIAADGLYDNGGLFLELEKAKPGRLRIADEE